MSVLEFAGMRVIEDPNLPPTTIAFRMNDEIVGVIINVKSPPPPKEQRASVTVEQGD